MGVYMCGAVYIIYIIIDDAVVINLLIFEYL